MPQHTATARVTLMIEVDVAGTWGSDSPIAKVYTQAAEEAAGHVRNLIGQNPDVRLVGEPQTQKVVADIERF